MHEIKPHSAHLAEMQARRTPTTDERFAALENAQTRTMLAVEALARKDSVRRDDDRRDDDKRDDRRRDDDDDDRRDARVARMIHDAVEHAMRKYDRKRREDDNVGGQEGEAERMAADDDRKRDDDGDVDPEHEDVRGMREKGEGEQQEQVEDDRRGDSVSARLTRLERNMRPRVLDADYLNELAECQSDWDKVAQMHGMRASKPMDGERVSTYDRRMATVFKKFSAKWQNEDLKQLPPSVMRNVAGPAIRADAVAAAYRADPSPGAMQREVRRQDRTGRWISEFVGPVGAANGALAPFRMQPMRVVSINRNPNG